MSQRPRGKRPPQQRTAQRAPQKQAQRGPRNAPPRPAPSRPFLTPDATPFRRAVELRSAKVVVFLRGLPRPVPGLIVIGIVATGLLAPPVVGGAALLLAALLLGWLSFLTWPAMPGPGRILRLVVIAMVVAYALVRFMGT